MTRKYTCSRCGGAGHGKDDCGTSRNPVSGPILDVDTREDLDESPSSPAVESIYSMYSKEINEIDEVEDAAVGETWSPPHLNRDCTICEEPISGTLAEHQRLGCRANSDFPLIRRTRHFDSKSYRYDDGLGIAPGDYYRQWIIGAGRPTHYDRRLLWLLTPNQRADLVAHGYGAAEVIRAYFRPWYRKNSKEKIRLPKAVRAALIEQPNVISGFASVARSITPPFSDSEMRYIIKHCNTNNLRGMLLLHGERGDQIFRLMAEGEATPAVRQLIAEGKVPPSVLSSMAKSRDPRKRAAAALGIYLPPEDENRLFSDEDPDVRAAMATTISSRINRARKYQDTDLIEHYENMRQKLANDPEPGAVFRTIQYHAFTEEGVKAIAEIRSTRVLVEIYNSLGSEMLWPTTEEYWEEVWSPGNYMTSYKRTRVNKEKQEMVDKIKKQILLKLHAEAGRDASRL